MPQLPLPLILLLALGLVVVLAALLAFLRPPSNLPYQCRPEFLTPAELVFFRSLEQAVDGKYYVFAKVRIGDLLCVIEGTENAGAWFGKIGQKHVDFMLADRKDVKPVLVVELDDSSHDLPHRQERDVFVDEALRTAGLSILRVPCRQDYAVSQLAQSIRRLATAA
jgi:hypothetical protein